MRFFKSKLSYKIINLIKNDKLIKNILTLSGGTAIAQIINILTQPLITRLYSPSEYGALTIFVSLLFILRISTLRYETAIPIARRDIDAVNLVAASVITLSVTTIIILLSLFFSGNQLLVLLNAKELSEYKYLIPIGVFFQGLFIIFTEWMYRHKNFKMVSKRTVTQSISGSISKISFGLLGLGGKGLIIGNILATGSGTYPLLKSFRQYKKSFNLKFDYREIKRVFFEYKDYPLFQAPSSLFLHMRNQLPVLMLAPLFGGQVVGYFGLANQIIQIPMSLIGNSVMSVFFAEIASLGKNNPEKIKKVSNELFKKLCLIGILPMLILFLFGPLLFELVFGPEWREAGIYARILSIYVFANFIFSPISRVFEVFSMQRLKMIIDLVSLLVIFFIFFMTRLFSFHRYLLISIYSICMFILYFFTYLVSKSVIDKAIIDQKKKSN